ncbi:Proclotting enzyme-like 6 [Homarus americanus]|uniref:Proclotting enzyme-like 6 n=1 Tax=Homarus americanus TaxID=6706 RepID=A0A8J5K6Q5_HOMAM|nr:Proclotting enzyme-like 6 [Homarus americanus]
MRWSWVLMGVVVWACVGVKASPEAAPQPEAVAEADPDPARGKRQLSAIGSMLHHMRQSFNTGLYTLGATIDHHVVPGVRYAAERITEDVAPSIGKAIMKAGNRVALKTAESVQATAQVVNNKIVPAIEDHLVEMGNAAVPYINHGIDVLEAGIQRGAQVVSRSTAKGIDRLGSKVLGEQRHNRVKNIAHNIQGGISSSLNTLASAITSFNSPQDSHTYPTTDRDYHDYIVSQYSDYNHDPQYTDHYYHSPDPSSQYYYSPDAYSQYSHSPLRSHQPAVRTVGEALSKVVDNTAYSLSTRLLGSNLTKAVAPLAKSVTKSMGQTIPAVSFGDGRIVIDLPGTETQKSDNVRGCTTPAGEQGYCKDLSDCPDLILDLTNLRKSVCFKSLFVPGVCCPSDGLESVNSVNDHPGRPRPVNTPDRPSRPVTAPPPPIPPLAITTRRPPPIQMATMTSCQIPFHTLFHFTGECGVPKIPTFRVVGGVESRRGQWPWMASVWLHGPKKTEFWCGGSLVSSQYILTAAHCTKDSRGKTFNPQQFSVRLGDHNIFSQSDDFISNPQTYRVTEIQPHPDFKAHGFYNDVALIRLDRPVDFTEYILPVCLPSENFSRRPLDSMVGQTPSVIGWGSTFYGGQESSSLREAQLPVWKNSDCNDAYFQPITEIFLCAGFGDSGGPLQLYTEGRWVQIGLVSFGNRCAEPGYPGVYTRITHFMPWIRSNLR